MQLLNQPDLEAKQGVITTLSEVDSSVGDDQAGLLIATQSNGDSHLHKLQGTRSNGQSKEVQVSMC